MVNSTISMEELKELAISTTDLETDIEGIQLYLGRALLDDVECIRSEDVLKVVKIDESNGDHKDGILSGVTAIAPPTIIWTQAQFKDMKGLARWLVDIKEFLITIMVHDIFYETKMDPPEKRPYTRPDTPRVNVDTTRRTNRHKYTSNNASVKTSANTLHQWATAASPVHDTATESIRTTHNDDATTCVHAANPHSTPMRDMVRNKRPTPHQIINTASTPTIAREEGVMERYGGRALVVEGLQYIHTTICACTRQNGTQRQLWTGASDNTRQTNITVARGQLTDGLYNV
eukprot:Awhi_evm1s6355